MDVHAAIRSQYLAALEMLKQSIIKCPEGMWDDPVDRNRFWYVAYHALFFTDYYLQDKEDDFQPRPGMPDDRLEITGGFIGRAEIIAYLSFCQQLIDERVPRLELGAPSGFGRRHFDKLELQLYSIRHIQTHAGELMERLGSRALIDVDWVSVAPR